LRGGFQITVQAKPSVDRASVVGIPFGMKTLFDYRDSGYSQSGEEGIILRIMDILGINRGLCCEFGAWDGIHLSNTRKLMESGWRGLMIEAEQDRFEDLKKTYPEGSAAISVCSKVGTGINSLASIARRAGTRERFDLVSIDIDGLDFQVFETLTEFEKPPLVVVIEVHTCHRADDEKPIPTEIAQLGCGQPFGLFLKTANTMGYRLVSFIGTNAFFVHEDAGHFDDLPAITGDQAAKQNLELAKSNKFAREYGFLVNLGKEQPGYKFNNPLFSRRSLGISPLRATLLLLRGKVY
jgi:hypothetical protein